MRQILRAVLARDNEGEFWWTPLPTPSPYRIDGLYIAAPDKTALEPHVGREVKLVGKALRHMDSWGEFELVTFVLKQMRRVHKS